MTDLSVPLHIDALKERLVEMAADAWRTVDVQLVAVLSQVQGDRHGGLGLVQGQDGGGHGFLGGGYLGGQPGLLALEQVERDGFGIVGLEEFQLLVAERLDPLAGDCLLPAQESFSGHSDAITAGSFDVSVAHDGMK